MPNFLRKEESHNVYEFECTCGSVGEIGVPVGSTKLIVHDCGATYIQRPPTGLFSGPRLIEVSEELRERRQ